MRGSRRGSLMVCVAILTYRWKGKNPDWTGAGMNEDAAVRADALLRSLHFLSGQWSVCNGIASASASAYASCVRPSAEPLREYVRTETGNQSIF